MNSIGYTKGLIYTDEIISGAEGAATSKVVYCGGAKAIMIAFTAVEAGTAPVAFNREIDITVEVNNDNGNSYHAYNMLIDNVTNSNAENITRVATKRITGAETIILWFSPETLGAITRFRVKLAVHSAGTKGECNVQASVCY